MRAKVRAAVIGILLTAISAQAGAQEKKHPGERHSVTVGIVKISYGKNRDTVNTPPPKPKQFSGAITFTRFDLGFTRLIENGGKLSEKNRFLEYTGGKTSHVSFDVAELAWRPSKNFRTFISAGFDWTLIRLRRNITIQKTGPGPLGLTYTTDTVQYKKNRFSNSYLHIPLMFEYRTNSDGKNKNFAISAGPTVDFLLNGKVKQVSERFGKVKYKDEYHFANTRYGGIVRMTYGGIGLFGKYYFTPTWDTDAQKDIHSMAIGLTLGL